jgi:hypothetical protein
VQEQFHHDHHYQHQLDDKQALSIKDICEMMNDIVNIDDIAHLGRDSLLKGCDVHCIWKKLALAEEEDSMHPYDALQLMVEPKVACLPNHHQDVEYA